jgi:malonyl-CoA O-methyltransferase
MSGIDRTTVRRSFDSGAREYDRYAVVQKRVLARFFRLLPPDITPAAILDIGSGTGALLRDLAVSYPEARLIGVDLAFGMGMIAKERLAGNRRVSFLTADADQLPFAESSFDLVVTTSTFQWLESLETAFRELRRVLRPGGRFCFALFGSRTLFELRESYRMAVQRAGGLAVDRTHRFKSVEDVSEALSIAGLDAEYLASEFEEETHPDVRHLLHSIKRIGAGNAAPIRARGLSERRVMLAMMEIYRRLYGVDDGVPATYEVIYGVGQRLPLQQLEGQH